MTAQWRFYDQQPTDPIHNPISGEFFSTDAVGNVTDALVREGIQNTLDARTKEADGTRHQAHVRIFLSEIVGALSPAKAQHWFGTLWPHILAPENGLRNQPGRHDPCPYLIFEDFGTTGLTGDHNEHRAIKNGPNHFLNFFRAEGHSDKGEQDRGSWGVGKTVFPRASRISSFFGLTIRNDDNKHLLLGRSILKYHRIDEQYYTSDGYFGQCRPMDRFMLPCGDPAILAEFRSDFRIKRQGESGLSIVVPWYEMNGDDAVNRSKVIAAVLRGFFYPILMGHLAVTIATPDDEITLDASSIMGKVESIGGTIAVELLPMLQLAEWANTRLDSEFQSLVAPTRDESQKWSPELVPELVADHIRNSLSHRQRVALRVPMHVQTRDGEPQPTYFNIFLEHSDEDREKPTFIRDELIIPRAGAPSVSQVRAIVIVDQRPIAKLLRDAEKPAHDEWSTKTANFKDKYKFGPGSINYVRHSVFELLSIVNQAEQHPDPNITIDYFSLPAGPEDEDTVPARQRKAKDKGEQTEKQQIQIKQRNPPRFRIDKMSGGFAIRPGDPGALFPPYIDIRVAYDIRRGNPLKRHHPADFDLGKAPIRWDESKTDGVEVKKAEGNRMLIQVHHQDFHLDVTGFDTDRELYVKADTKEVADD